MELVTATEVDGCVSVYSPSCGSVLILNETASVIWRLADGQRSVEDVIDALSAAYGVTADDIRGGVESTIGSFVRHGLIAEVLAMEPTEEEQ